MYRKKFFLSAKNTFSVSRVLKQPKRKKKTKTQYDFFSVFILYINFKRNINSKKKHRKKQQCIMAAAAQSSRDIPNTN